MCLMPYANNKGAGQPAHPRGLISTFIVRWQDRMLLLVYISEILRFYLVSVAEQDSLCLAWSQTPKIGFLVARLIYTFCPLAWMPNFQQTSFSITRYPVLHIMLIWAASWQTEQYGMCTQRSLVSAVRMKKTWILSYPFSAHRRLWSDWADAQADLSLRWAHSHFVGFVMRRLIYREGRLLWILYGDGSQ